jgi:hypothetical protein
LVNLRESNLEVSTVGKITISGDRAGNTATEIGLARESLFNRFHGEVSMSAVRNFPESDLRGSGKEDILGAIGDELKKSTTHSRLYILPKDNNFRKNTLIQFL